MGIMEDEYVRHGRSTISVVQKFHIGSIHSIPIAALCPVTALASRDNSWLTYGTCVFQSPLPSLGSFVPVRRQALDAV